MSRDSRRLSRLFWWILCWTPRKISYFFHSCNVLYLFPSKQSLQCKTEDSLCKPLLAVIQYTTMGGAAEVYGNQGYSFHQGSKVAKKIEAWIQKEINSSQYHGCTVCNLCNMCMKPKGNETDAIPLSQCSGELPAGQEHVRQDNPDSQEHPQNPGKEEGAPEGGAHDPIRDEAVDGEQLMIPRVPRLPHSARPIAEHDLTGPAVYRSWCRHCVASKARAHAYASRQEGELPDIGLDYGFFGRDREDASSMLCVKMPKQFNRMLGSDRKRASNHASSNFTAFVASFGFNWILVRSHMW